MIIESIKAAIGFLLHVDKNLAIIIAKYGVLTYGILFVIIFIETGLVVVPFLPGDSLLFAAGAFAANGSFNLLLLFGMLVAAAFLGDTANYWIGYFIGPKAFDGNSKFLKKEYLHKAQAFYDKHGGKAIVLARFVPIVRTFAPFVAGIGKMKYGHFITYNIIGGVAWVSLTLFGGYFFGNLNFVKNNFEVVIIAIVLISILPIAYEAYQAKKSSAS